MANLLRVAGAVRDVLVELLQFLAAHHQALIQLRPCAKALQHREQRIGAVLVGCTELSRRSLAGNVGAVVCSSSLGAARVFQRCC